MLLDQANEFRRDALDAVGQTLEAGQALIARQGMVTRFPARFTLVLTAGTCPCASVSGDCECSPAARRRHLGQLPGQLLDRVDLKVVMPRASRNQMRQDARSAEDSAVVAERVAAARDRASSRSAGTPWRANAEIPGAELRQSFALQPAALAVAEQAVITGRLTSRGRMG